MNGIYISGMEIPKNGSMLVKINSDGHVSTTAMNNYRKYEAICVPDHGRLIDLDVLLAKSTDVYENRADGAGVYGFSLGVIKNMPAIIPPDK